MAQQVFKNPLDQANEMGKQYDVYLKAGDKKPSFSTSNEKEAHKYISENGGAGQIDVVKVPQPDHKELYRKQLNGWLDDVNNKLSKEHTDQQDRVWNEQRSYWIKKLAELGEK